MDRRLTPASNITVGVYYFVPLAAASALSLLHNDDATLPRYSIDKNLREHLTPHQSPYLDDYPDDSTAMNNGTGSSNTTDQLYSRIVAQHLSWSRYAGIAMWAVSYYERDDTNDTVHNMILDQMEELEIGNDDDLKMALVYEGGRDTNNMEKVVSDIEYICENYIHHANYYHIKDRPVLFLHLTELVETSTPLLEGFLELVRSVSCGTQLFLVGDLSIGGINFSAMQALGWFDAVSNSDFYGGVNSSSPYAGQQALDAYFENQRQWKVAATATSTTTYIPCISPGYNDRGRGRTRDQILEEDHEASVPLSRRVTEDADEGSLFAQALEGATPSVDASADNLIMINSWNNWCDDTQIEPTAVTSSSSSHAGRETSLPENYTMGLSYVAYGQLYLDILRAAIMPDADAAASWRDVLTKGGTIGGETDGLLTAHEDPPPIGDKHTGSSSSKGNSRTGETKNNSAGGGGDGDVAWIIEKGEPEANDLDANS
eukprot:CAMPEP_0119019920 /NCGR_PEP_ID=MMETSP1176-20130426/22969_1 /TAXON_ID=265551 /ORGANISM="Synedropsis recta cf, Strain CCMP1620" /LENGTH=486 /DNA_ID=CAMNT_0006974247 /DNA_START=185 /DNA_END=1645 /DNA_ORIENTATION=-